MRDVTFSIGKEDSWNICYPCGSARWNSMICLLVFISLTLVIKDWETAFLWKCFFVYQFCFVIRSGHDFTHGFPGMQLLFKPHLSHVDFGKVDDYQSKRFILHSGILQTYSWIMLNLVIVFLIVLNTLCWSNYITLCNKISTSCWQRYIMENSYACYFYDKQHSL